MQKIWVDTTSILQATRYNVNQGFNIIKNKVYELPIDNFFVLINEKTPREDGLAEGYYITIPANIRML